MSALPSFDNTLGALLIGFGLSTALFGMFLVQSQNYFHRYPLDKAGYKAIVAILLLLETLHQVLIGHSVYYYTVTNYANILALLDKPVWSLVFQLLVGAVVGSIVKFLFALRVWRFSYGNWWVTGLLLLLDVAQLVLAIIFTVKSYALSTLPELINLRVLGVVALAIGVVNDIGIAISLCYYLQSMRSTYNQSNSVIRCLTIYAVSTGVLTSAWSFTTLIIYNFMPTNLIFVCCYFVLSKIYAVSFVAALNTRQLKREQRADDDPKKVASFQIVTDQRTSPLNIPLETPTATRGDVESYTVEDNGVSVPSCCVEALEPTREQRPDYTHEW